LLFNSYVFIFVYLPIVFIGTFLIGKRNQSLAIVWLCIASIFFYALWDVSFVLLLVLSITFNYSTAYYIGKRLAIYSYAQAKKLLTTAIAINLLILGYFKYANFFITTTTQIFGYNFPSQDIILPIGISFFTFTQIAFLVDVYRGKVKEYNFTRYMLFVTYFPHLIAGPVLHHKQMMPQFGNSNTFRINAENIAVGMTIFVLGLAKKVVIADTLANYATPIFNAASHGYKLGLVEAWLGALAYTFQLYFDFSGYSDMAIGISLMFNVRLPMNFNSPYKSTNIIEFWRRWHITLSTFLRDYLYIPLGGNRKGLMHRYINIMATMLLGGLWHGAGWTFIAWGGLHGLYLIVNHGWQAVKPSLKLRAGAKIAKTLSVLTTFMAVVVAWVFFRSDSISSAISMLSSMFALYGGTSSPETYGFITGVDFNEALKSIFLCIILIWFLPNTSEIFSIYKPTWDQFSITKPQPIPSPERKTLFIQWKLTRINAFILGGVFSIIILYMAASKTSEFLYFQF